MLSLFSVLRLESVRMLSSLGLIAPTSLECKFEIIVRKFRDADPNKRKFKIENGRFKIEVRGRGVLKIRRIIGSYSSFCGVLAVVGISKLGLPFKVSHCVAGVASVLSCKGILRMQRNLASEKEPYQRKRTLPAKRNPANAKKPCQCEGTHCESYQSVRVNALRFRTKARKEAAIESQTNGETKRLLYLVRTAHRMLRVGANIPAHTNLHRGRGLHRGLPGQRIEQWIEHWVLTGYSLGSTH